MEAQGLAVRLRLGHRVVFFAFVGTVFAVLVASASAVSSAQAGPQTAGPLAAVFNDVCPRPESAGSRPSSAARSEETRGRVPRSA